MVRLSLLRLAQTIANQVTATPSSTTSITRLPPLPSPKELLKLYKIHARKRLSQNFLLDAKISNKIVTKTGKMKNCYVCEVGPGPGNITRNILMNGAKHVIVVEKDRRFLPSLELLADASGGRLRIILADIMDLSLENILPKDLRHGWTGYPPPLYVIGNLPFNISTPLIIKWLKHCSSRTGPFIHGRTQLALTFQLEVGNRMVAKPGARNRCRLSVVCQYLCHVDNMFTIPGRAFFPKPEVDVSVVKFTPRIRPLIDKPFEIVNKVVSTIFQHRQKFCLYGITNLFPNDRKDLIEELITQSKIDPERRAYQLEMEEWKALCDAYSEMCEKFKGLKDYQYQLHRNEIPHSGLDGDSYSEDVDSLGKDVDSFDEDLDSLEKDVDLLTEDVDPVLDERK